MTVLSTPNRSRTDPVAADQHAEWGRLPALSIGAACGLAIATLSYAASRDTLPWAMLLFWGGVLLLCLPVMGRLWFGQPDRTETLGLLLLLGIALYLVSVLRSPAYFAGYDELLHWRTADDILQTHRLFTYNSMLPVSPLYPGLETTTDALVDLTGLSIHAAGTVVVGTARIVLILALFLILEMVSGSTRAAALGTGIYMGSSTFVFFDSQFAYESLGLPLAAFVVYLLLRRSTSTSRTRCAWGGLGALAILATGTVHHLTAFLLSAFLVLWAVATEYVNRRGGPAPSPAKAISRRRRRGLARAARHVKGGGRLFPADSGAQPQDVGIADVHQPSLVWPAALLLIWNLFWLFSVASITIPYLAPHAQDLLTSIQRLMTGEGGSRPVLGATPGGINYERLLALASVAAIFIGLGLGFWGWRKRGSRHPLSLALALCALGYPAIPALRLFDATWEISNRLAGFLFVGVGLIVGLGLAELPVSDRWRQVRRWVVVPGLAVVVCGGIVSGSNPVTRLPGPYRVIADERSVDAQGLASAETAYHILGPDNRMAGDRIQSSLMGSYGRQRIVTHQADGVSISGIFLKPVLGDTEMRIIETARIRYLVIDRRIAEGLPLFGYYFESWEQMVVAFVPPPEPTVLNKFDGVSGVSRVLDSGDIRVYDIGGLGNAP